MATTRNSVRLLRGSRLTDGREPRSLLPEATAGLQDAQDGGRLPRQWRLGKRLTTVGDVAVLEVRDGADLVAVLKLSRSPAGDSGLETQVDVLERLRADPGLRDWRRYLPPVLASGRAGHHRYTVEAAVPGEPGDRLGPRLTHVDAWGDAIGAIGGLHRATGAATEATGAAIDAWAEPALSLLVEVPLLQSRGRRLELTLALRNRLRESLEGRPVWISRTHGDYAPGNILYDDAGRVTGIIDWAQSREADPAVIDPMTFVLVSRARAGGVPLGRVVADLARGGRLTADETALFELHRALCPVEPPPVAVMAQLAWLRHVETNLLKSPRYANHPVWVHQNVGAVLKSVAR
jgi:Phosphotransferase enzyme family